MLHETIKDYIQGYHDMKLISENFENKLSDAEYNISKFATDNEYIMSLRTTTILGFYRKKLNLITCIYINKETKNTKCTATVKTPANRNIYNNIVPSLFWKLNKYNFNNVCINKDKLNNLYFYDDSDDTYGYLQELEATIVYTNDDDSFDKIAAFINVVDLYNETIYDKLIEKHKKRN